MNIQISDLTVTDPLAEQEVAVVVRIFPDNAQRNADFPDAGQEARVLAQSRVVRRFERGDNLESLVGMGDRRRER